MKALLLAFLPALAAGLAAGDVPLRVVSMNLCTDQLALLVAAPGQLVSVSNWASRADASNLAAEAADIPPNAATAEEVFMLAPDLVLAGSYTNRAGLALLERLGLRLETFAPAQDLDDIRDDLRRMGRLLGRDAEAETIVAQLDAGLARIAARVTASAPNRAVYQYPNGFTSGADTLASELLSRAGFVNAAAEAGLTGAAHLPLEMLVMLDPFLVMAKHISGTDTGRAFEAGHHPALAALGAGSRSVEVEERWQVCGTPFVLNTLDALVAAGNARANAKLAE